LQKQKKNQKILQEPHQEQMPTVEGELTLCLPLIVTEQRESLATLCLPLIVTEFSDQNCNVSSQCGFHNDITIYSALPAINSEQWSH
jgi:hypothetical protein